MQFPTPLVEKVYRYRKIPLKELSVEQVRMLVSQNIGVNFLIPHAIEILDKDLLAAGDHYEGDLLNAVLTAEEYWKENPDAKRSFQEKIPGWKELLLADNNDNSHRQLLKTMVSFCTDPL